MFTLHYNKHETDEFPTLEAAQKAACIYAENILFVNILNNKESAYKSPCFQQYHALLNEGKWTEAYKQIKLFFPITVDNCVVT